MSRIPGQSVADTNHRLVESAMRRFSRFGVANTKIGDICADADVSRKTLYEYYDGKYDLFQSVLNSEADFFLSKLRSIDNSAGSENALRSIFNLIFDEFASGFGFLMSELAFNDAIRIPDRAKKATHVCLKIVDEAISMGIEGGQFHADVKSSEYLATMNILINGFYSSASAVEQMMDIDLWSEEARAKWREHLASTLISSISR